MSDIDNVASAPEIQPTEPSPESPSTVDWRALYEATKRNLESARGNTTQLSQKNKKLQEQLTAASDAHEKQLAEIAAEKERLAQELLSLRQEHENLVQQSSKMEKRFRFLSERPELADYVLQDILIIDDVDGEELQRRVERFVNVLSGQRQQANKQIGAAPPPPPAAAASSAYTPEQVRKLYSEHITNRTVSTPEGAKIKDLYFQMVRDGLIR